MRYWGLRLRPSGEDRTQELLEQNIVAIGWSDTPTLLNRRLSRDAFREILSDTYPDLDIPNALAHTWRFIREFAIGDIVLIPDGDRIYFAQIAGDPYADPEGANTDTVLRRSVIRLFTGIPVSRQTLPKVLREALGFRRTSVDLSDVEPQISALLKKMEGGDVRPLKAIQTRSGTATAMNAWRRAFTKVGRTDHGFSPSTIWVEELGIWLAIGGWERDGEHRYWTGLGDRLGSKNSRNLVVEVNPPASGPPRRWQGLTAKSEDGTVWILHSGEMNVGGTRIQLSDALDLPFPRKLVRFSDGAIYPYYVVAELTDDPYAVATQSSRFMHVCAKIRTRVTDADSPDFIDAHSKALLLEESLGFTSVPAQGPKTIERVHARIWHAVRKDLEAKGFKVANQRVGSLGPDLYTVGGGKRYLIEIKTAYSASDYMKAVGQLIVYEKTLKAEYRKILILPKGLGIAARQLLTALDIAVVDYDDRKSGAFFDWGSALAS
ncbi:hypothetical protein AB4Z25_24895 [Rhizobium sp. RAF36]|uniref:hypothetical protein n=1 Tax=Rhizobium sp. RAF36 TaxID=3233055 RepID=UPI003F98ADF3